MGCFLGLCNIGKALKKLGNQVEKFFRPITKVAIVGAAAYYGGGAILAAPGGAAAAGSVISGVLNGRRASSAGPLPQENVASYGVPGQVYVQGREPYYSPATPQSIDYGMGSSGSSFMSPTDTGSGDTAPPGMSPLMLVGVAVAGVLLFMILRRR